MLCIISLLIKILMSNTCCLLFFLVLSDVGTQSCYSGLEDGDATVEISAHEKWKPAWTVPIFTEDVNCDAHERMVKPHIPFNFDIMDDKNYTDGYGFFSIQRIVEFIAEATEHTACCGVGLSLEDMHFTNGASITMKFHCSRCCSILALKNCKSIKTDFIEEGRKFSCVQPELNIRIPKAAREVGINLEKIVQFVSFMGVKMCTYKNLLHAEKKIRLAIEHMSHEILEQNLRDHVTAARNQIGYAGDILWTDENNNQHSTCRGPGSFDGAGLTRAYNHRIKGCQTVLVVFSLLIKNKKPKTAVHNQVNGLIITMQLLFSHIYCYLIIS